ncbi:hypothetical protein QE197_14540 [Arsenophonus nasoniae]|nr:hypothetical protein [Arsenophonus nasoniae]MDR5612043.1 hypothetical protein [Arsenophonus sp.]QBY44726.1 hypothetical protein ArsFIN_33120 [Arsenophonus nasoniae]WGM04950.1 hypothetical protein QE258_15370 [Arsenophonus nasoniae]WGM05022.1 hypothetical protein QE258_15795 [Arsenophonus nasoniae]WGM10051.1 hypothetical protein QE197_14540 [Arsenophonus nasoniae]
MWILILAMYASPYSSSNVASLHTQEFDTENMCQFAAKQFEREFETFKDINAKAICVKK